MSAELKTAIKQQREAEKTALLYEQMQLLYPLLMQTRDLQESLNCLGDFAERFLPSLSWMGLVRLDSRSHYRAMSSWRHTLVPNDPILSNLLEYQLDDIVSNLQQGLSINDQELEELFRSTCQEAEMDHYPTLFPLRNGTQLIGLAFYGKDSGHGRWSNEEKQVLLVLSSIMGITFANQNLHEDYVLQSWAFNAMMDRMQTNLYVTDPRTHQILFMNKTMKRAFGVSDVEGKFCWQVLQEGMTGPCPFCPVPALLENPSAYPRIRWEEYNTRTGRIYQNYDSLMTWIDGSLVHFQHSEDITDSKRLSKDATTDELTGLLNRRGGNERLHQLLLEPGESRRPFVVTMYDVNSLKQVNDNFGHQEGDRLLRLITEGMRSALGEDDFGCRLSGDEFLSVFHQADKSEGARRIAGIRTWLEHEKQARKLPYEVGFCCGQLELTQGMDLKISEILSMVDSKMYQEKRLYHQQMGALGGPHWRLLQRESFRYDPKYFYDALAESTEDYLYVCDMTTETFRYCPALVRDFPLPGEVIQNALHVWQDIIHPEDWEKFQLANRQVTAYVDHDVVFRARDRQNNWVHLHCRGHMACDETGLPRVFAGFMARLDK